MKFFLAREVAFQFAEDLGKHARALANTGKAEKNGRKPPRVAFEGIFE